MKTLQTCKDEVAKEEGYPSYEDALEIHDHMTDQVAKRYANETGIRFLLGKMVRYRYVDWDFECYTPWSPCTEIELKKFDDKSIDIIQFKL